MYWAFFKLKLSGSTVGMGKVSEPFCVVWWSALRKVFGGMRMSQIGRWQSSTRSRTSRRRREFCPRSQFRCRVMALVH